MKINDQRPSSPQIPSKLFSSLVSRLIAENRELWNIVKSDINNGLMPDLYGSLIGSQFEAEAVRLLKSLPAEDVDLLNAYARQITPSSARNVSCSTLMVAHVMRRATQVVSRHGYYI